MMHAVMQEVQCNSCGSVAYPSLNLNDRMVLAPCCPACGAEHMSMAANDMRGTAHPELMPARAAVSGWAIVGNAPDPVKAIEARLAFLDEELAKLDGYNKERRRLRRMLKAAGDSA